MSNLKLIYSSPPPPEGECDPSWTSDLGKATRRGVKQCPDCGCTNGTRCYVCKNPRCNRILKDAGKHKASPHIDAVQLHTGTSRRLYSVRMRAESGSGGGGGGEPEHRGFVQLPTALYRSVAEVALCFVADCERSYSILECHENEDDEDEGKSLDATNKSSSFCVHIESAVKSLSVAHCVDFKHDLINHLKTGDNVRKMVCALATSTDAPLVQRIARNVLAIKCFVNSSNPLGYLHFRLDLKRSPGGEETIEGWYCECCGWTPMEKCLHYFAFVCAFASDLKLMKKYGMFLQDEFDSDIVTEPMRMDDGKEEEGYPMENIRIEILRPDILGLPQSNQKRSKRCNKTKTLPEPRQKIRILSNDIFTEPIQPLINSESSTNDLLDNFIKLPNYDKVVDITFEEWFTSVIEKMNSRLKSTQSIEYDDGNMDDYCSRMNFHKEKLEFDIPNRFFYKIQEIIANNTRNQAREYPREQSHILQYDFTQRDEVQRVFCTSLVRLQMAYLVIDDCQPFCIRWLDNVYVLSRFGELHLTFVRCK